MALFTDEMTRLSGEINASHRMRKIFLKQLGQETWQRKRAVLQMQADFTSARTLQARRAKAELTTFLGRLRREVGRRRRELSADLAGARRVWGPAVLLFEKRWPAEAPSPPRPQHKKASSPRTKKAR